MTDGDDDDQERPEVDDLDAAVRSLSHWNGVSDFYVDDEPLGEVVAATERGFAVTTGVPYDVEALIRRTPGLAEELAGELAQPRPAPRSWKPRRPGP